MRNPSILFFSVSRRNIPTGQLKADKTSEKIKNVRKRGAKRGKKRKFLLYNALSLWYTITR